MKFCREILETPRYRTVQTRTHYLTWAPIAIGSWWTDRRQTDRRTDRITAANMRYSYASSRA